MIKIEKPLWCSKEKGPIYSIDIHPDDSRFATCQDKKIFIWRTQRLKSPPQPTSKTKIDDKVEIHLLSTKSKNELVCELDYHQNPINCIKFSPNGKMLAACSDDFTVSIYYCDELMDLSNTTLAVEGFNKNIEDWKFYKLFRKHNKDVLGVSWSPDSKLLASCSVDNTTIVYDVAKQDAIQTLKGHDDIVKAVSFDPLNKYLATQSDKMLILWSTSTWEQKYVITEIFEKSLGNTIFFRPSWSPDGSIFITGNGLKKKQHSAPLFLRNQNFTSERDYSGHKDVVIAASFNPVAFENEKNPSIPVFYTAIGSLDCSLSIWSSLLSTPLLVVRDLFDNGILGVSWSSSGYDLICCSNDGTVAYIHFDKTTLGECIPAPKWRDMVREQYGEVGTTSSLLEAPSQMNNSRQLSSITQKSNASSSKTQQVIVTQQKETITKDGRRRIQPKSIVTKRVAPTESLFLDLNEDYSSHPSSSSSSSNPTPTQQPQQTSTQDAARTIMEQRSEGGITSTSFDSSPPTTTLATAKPVTSAAPAVTVTRRVGVTTVEQSKSNISKSTLPAPGMEPIQPAFVFEVKPIHLQVNANEEFKCSEQGDCEYVLNDKKHWSATVWGGPVMAAATNLFTAVCCVPNIVHTFLRSGRRPFPPIMLEATAAHIACEKQNLLILTQNLRLLMWNITQGTSLLNVSASPLTNNISNVDDVGITRNGRAVITLNNGESYAWHQTLSCFVCVADAHASTSPFITSAMHLYDRRQMDNNQDSDVEFDLGYLRAKSSKNIDTHRGTGIIEELEIGMAAADALGDDKEYMRFAKAYARQLSQSNNEVRLREWCDWLVGPLHGTWDSKVVGLDKNDVLRQVLGVMEGNSSTQRIVQEFRDVLEFKKKD
ncbi:hypothetical protein AKO1_012729 [Acrasis kona]|uniref:Protein HIRA n=1 Tax=Acrasis kona TaxID=1008807 RepID=A0AAW2YYJ8_9EUKA